MEPLLENDSVLIARIVAGDRLASEYFDAKFRPRLLRFLVDRIPPQDCDDLVQEVLLAAFNELKRDGFKGDSSLGTWLIGILRHKIADYRRKQPRDALQLSLIGSPVPSQTESVLDAVPDHHHCHPDVTIETKELLALLTKNERICIILSLRERWTTNEIAAFMKLPAGTVGRLIWAAKRRLQERPVNLKKLEDGSDK